MTTREADSSLGVMPYHGRQALYMAVAVGARRRRALSGVRTAAQEAFQKRYWHDLEGFVLDCFDWAGGDEPTPYQREVLRNFPKARRYALRGPHGLGKTAMASWIVLWFALTRDGKDWKVVTTAGNWRQLSKYLWPEIHKWGRRLKWPLIGREEFGRLEFMQMSMRLGTGEAFGVASTDPALIEGAHADNLLYLFDESKSIPAGVFDAAEGALSVGDCYALAISTPGDPEGRFFEIHRRAKGTEDWTVRHVKRAEVIAAGRMNPEWAEQRKAQWGKDSQLYLNRIEGEFAASSEDVVIPLAWVEAANERWHAFMDRLRDEQKILDDRLPVFPPLTHVGCDVGITRDKTVLAPRAGPVLLGLRRYGQSDTMQTAGRLAGMLEAYPQALAVVDAIGIGAGVVHRLRELKRNVYAFVASEGTSLKDHNGELGYANVRSASWWGLRELLDPAYGENIALPPDDMLTGDLTTPKYKIQSGGRILVESKDEIRKRLDRSTDDGDAVVQAFYAGVGERLVMY